MSKKAILDIIEVSQKISRAAKGGTIKSAAYLPLVKPWISEFQLQHRETPNVYIQQYLKSLKGLETPFKLKNYQYLGRQAVKDFVWACYCYQYPWVKEHFASYSPQLYILVHSTGLKFGLDYGSEVQNENALVSSVVNHPDIVEEIIRCNQVIPAYTLTKGSPRLATSEELVELSSEDKIRANWNNSIHLIQQFGQDEIPEDIDERIYTTFQTLAPLFEKLCRIGSASFSLPESKKTNVPDEEAPEIISGGDDKDEIEKDFTMDDFLDEVFVDRGTAETFINNLTRKKNIILQGPPGTGKTFVASRIGYLLLGKRKDRNIKVVQFHQSYSYEDFIQGFRPDKEGGFSLRNGIFHDFVELAIKNPSEPFVFVIDEINRGNLSKIFGELLLLIEDDKRGHTHALNLTYQPDKKFYIPPNLHIVGTMNTADRSLAMVDYALRRRFRFIDLEPRYGEKLRRFLELKGISSGLTDKIYDRIERLNNQIQSDENLGSEFRIGHSYFCSVPYPLKSEISWYSEIIKYEIGPLLREYWFDDRAKAEEEILFLDS